MPKFKIDEISLPFSGESTKMPYLEFRVKDAKIGKNTYFSKIALPENCNEVSSFLDFGTQKFRDFQKNIKIFLR